MQRAMADGLVRGEFRSLQWCWWLRRLAVSAALVVFACGVVQAAKLKVETRYLRLTFNSPDDLSRFHKNIDFDSGQGAGGLFAKQSAEEDQAHLIAKLDALYEKVQRILDMRKPNPEKVRVQVHSDKEELAAMFQRVFKRPGFARAWYVYEYNTVYMNVADVHEGMLAHELAHAIIDHFMSVRPPRATAEILATYVDKHLFEEVKTY